MLLNHHVDREEASAKMFGRVLGTRLWEDKDIDLLISQRRPISSYNFLLPLALHLAGTQIQTRSSMKATPLKDATVEDAYAMTNLMMWNWDKTFFEFEQTRAFLNTIITSMGWTYDQWNFTKGHWVCKSIDPFRIRWDIATKERDFSDCRFLQDTMWGTGEEVINMAGDEQTREEILYRIAQYEPKMNSHAWVEKIFDSSFNWTPTGDSRADDYLDLKMGRYRVIDHHEKRQIPTAALIDGFSGAYEVVTDKPAEQIKAMMRTNPNFDLQRFNVTQNWHGIICPAIEMVLAEEKYEVETPDNDYIFKPQLCYDFHPDLKQTIGVFDNLYGIVQSINKRKSTMLEYIMSVTGGDFIAEDRAIEGYEEDWNTPGFKYVRKYKTGSPAPKRDYPPSLPEGVWKYEAEDLQFLEMISGVTKNARGMRDDAGESGVLVKNKIQQAEIQLTYLMNNMTFSQKKLAISCVHNIQAYMTEEDVVFLTDYQTGKEIFMDINKQGEDGQALNNITKGSYNISIDVTKPSVSSRQMAFLQGVEMARVGMPPDFMRWDLIIKNSDIPHAAEWSAYIKMLLKMKYGIDVDTLENIDMNKLSMLGGQGAQGQALQGASSTINSMMGGSPQNLNVPNGAGGI